MEKKENKLFGKKKEEEEDDNENDMAFIDDNVQESRNKLNISINEKDELDDLDDEQVEKEFTEFLQEIQKDDEGKDFLNQMNMLMESGITGTNNTFNDDFLFDTTGGLESFANSFIKQMIKKEIIYEPLKEAKKQLQEHMGSNSKYRTPQNKDKLKLLNDSIQILDKQDYNSSSNQDQLVKNFENLNEKGGLPDEILKKCMGNNNKDFDQFSNLMKQNKCNIF